MNWHADQEQPRLQSLRRRIEEPHEQSLRLAVLAAHPDDETIGASALLARFPQSLIIYLTDGAPRDRNLWPPGMAGEREQYAAVRRREAAEALGHAGVSEKQIFWLGGVDQEAIFEARALALKLTEFVRTHRVELLITHPYEGGHPDHDAAALIAQHAMTILGEASCARSEMTSYHARDGQCVTGEFLGEDCSSEIVFELSQRDCKRKRQMMDAYTSQRQVLGNFPVLSERLRSAPKYDFSHAPHEGKLWYECMQWPTTGERWRELASTAFAQRQECSCG
jgi:LmbE family N-acetylglucosaminyl deacetylase